MRIDDYFDLLLDYNRKVNLVSRQSTISSLAVLVSETMLLKEHVSTPLVIDAGSGGGLLGIPLALSLPGKEFVLVETIQKKVVFLREALRQLGLANASVYQGAVLEFMHRHKRPHSTLASRGFPRAEALADFVFRGKVRELLLISSSDKVEKITAEVAKFRQTRYNIPSRDKLIVFKLEHVSRETRGPWVKS